MREGTTVDVSSGNSAPGMAAADSGAAGSAGNPWKEGRPPTVPEGTLPTQSSRGRVIAATQFPTSWTASGGGLV